MRQVLGILLVLYAFAILQMSFFVYFFPNGFVPNLIILSVLFLSVFERQNSYGSLASALVGGFLIDVFSGGIIGIWAFILLVTSFLIKRISENYVRLSIPKKF